VDEYGIEPVSDQTTDAQSEAIGDGGCWQSGQSWADRAWDFTAVIATTLRLTDVIAKARVASLYALLILFAA